MGVRPPDLLVFGTFWGLLLALAIGGRLLPAFRQRSLGEWGNDAINLFFQGTAIPFLQAVVVAGVLRWLFPHAAGSLVLPPVLAFLLVFVGVDYLYYWNHRLFHRPAFWPIHQVHHAAPRMDVLVSSRNTVWTTVFIVYLWVNGGLLFLAADPLPIVWAASCTAALDLWRHSSLQPPVAIASVFGQFMTMPNDHAWHHARDVHDVNFGANFNLWDRLHGTFLKKSEAPDHIGVPVAHSWARQLLWPWP